MEEYGYFRCSKGVCGSQELYIGGDFSSLNGSSRSYLGALFTSNGSTANFNPNVNSDVDSVVASADGSKLYVGGLFTSVGGSSAYQYFASFSAANVTLSKTVATATSGGTGDSYTAVLTAPPSGNVTLTPTPDSYTLVSPSTLTFTTSNWNIPQTVNITASSTQTSPTGTSTITNIVTSSDLAYNGFATTTVTVNIAYLPTVTSPATSTITETGATLGATMTSGSASTTIEGFNYGTDLSYGYTASTTYPSGTSTGPFSKSIAGLSCGSQYHFRAFATNSAGTGTSSDATFTTNACTATEYAFIGPSSGNIYSTSTNFTVTPSSYPYTGTIILTPTGTGSSGLSPIILTFENSSIAQTFTITPTTAGTITLTPTNSGGLTDASPLTYTVNSIPPTVSAPTTGSITTTSAVLNSSITIDGGASSTIEGFVWGTTPSYGATTTETGTFGLGHFSTTLSSLTCNTTYHYAPYAVNSAGTSTYPTDTTFTTSACPVIPATPTISYSSGGGSVSPSILTTLLAPSASTTVYLNSLATTTSTVPGCPVGMTCTPIPGFTPNTNKIPASAGMTNGAGMTEGTGMTNAIFTRNLQVGSIGTDVKALQQYLNTHGFIIATTGPGSPSNETNMFGSLTKSALIKFQKANNITPAVGYFGPITRGVIMNKS